jgi:arabinogalactan oligomer/maltooligosaccharide transport system substrate-binding protein
MKKLLLLLTLIFVAFAAVGCGGAETTTAGGNTTTVPVVAGTIKIWVGAESQAFYTEKVEDYKAYYLEQNGTAFPHNFQVVAVDTGSAAGVFLNDTEAGADIFTSAHDNLGRLIAGSSAVMPVQSQALLDQIENDNPEMFLNVIKGTFSEVEYTFAIPYVAQSLVLYYNKAYIDETQVQTWEGILAAAQTAGKKALALAGTDGFNNSFILLAREAETKATSLRLYEGNILENTNGTGDDTIAKLKWGQSFFTHPNGVVSSSSTAWEVQLQSDATLAFIGGAWHYEAAKSSLGNDLGIAVLPTFTITEADAYGTCEAGTVFQSGSFFDTKAFFMKKGSAYQPYLEDILLYLTSKEVQEESFEEAQNLPAYKNALTEFEAFQDGTLETLLAATQLRMSDFSIPQPFGGSSKFNTYYYQKGAPDLILEILENRSNLYSTHAQILAQMQYVETIWKTGVNEKTN